MAHRDRRPPAVPQWLVNLCNRINDMDLTWAGFRRLRPAVNQDMSAQVVAWLCVVYCPLSALLTFAIAYLIIGRRAPIAVPGLIAGAAALLFLVMQNVLARAWNRRAARRRAEKQP
jgi:uncharacterized membrane protein